MLLLTSIVGVTTLKVAAVTTQPVTVVPTAGVYGVHVPLLGTTTVTIGATVYPDHPVSTSTLLRSVLSFNVAATPVSEPVGAAMVSVGATVQA